MEGGEFQFHVEFILFERDTFRSGYEEGELHIDRQNDFLTDAETEKSRLC